MAWHYTASLRSDRRQRPQSSWTVRVARRLVCSSSRRSPLVFRVMKWEGEWEIDKQILQRCFQNSNFATHKALVSSFVLIFSRFFRISEFICLISASSVAFVWTSLSCSGWPSGADILNRSSRRFGCVRLVVGDLRRSSSSLHVRGCFAIKIVRLKAKLVFFSKI